MLNIRILVPSAILALVLSDKTARAQCRKGSKAGKKLAKKLWKKFGKECTKVYKFEKKAYDKLIEGKFAHDEFDDDWKTEAFKECAQEAVEAFIAEKQEECLVPELCEELGDLAAGKIVNDFCPEDKNGGGGVGGSRPDYPKLCRATAIDRCEGSLYDRIKKECESADYDSNVFGTPELKELKEECEDEVDNFIE